MKKYNLFKNASYAIEGFIEVLKNETAFKLQILIFIIQLFLAFILNIEIYLKLFIILGAIFPVIIEIINSAIERVVDLITKDYHILAKRAKDAASAAVMISFLVPIITWSLVLIKVYS